MYGMGDLFGDVKPKLLFQRGNKIVKNLLK